MYKVDSDWLVQDHDGVLYQRSDHLNLNLAAFILLEISIKDKKKTNSTKTLSESAGFLTSKLGTKTKN